MRAGSELRGSSPPFPRASSWEDPALLDALGAVAGAHVVVFEPSGDDALLLCARGARVVDVVAPDTATAALIELKRAAARELPVQSVRSFLGLGHFGRRVWFYHHLRAGLSDAVRAWGDTHEEVVRAGLVGQGAVERAVTELHARVLPLTVGRAAVEALLTAPDLDTQREVVRTRWRGLRWRAAARLWLPRIARLAGADGHGAPGRLDALLDTLLLAGSPFARALLAGDPPDAEALGTWLAAATLPTVKANVGALRVAVGTRAEGLARGPYDAVVLGRRPLAGGEADALIRGLRPGGRVLGWGPTPDGLCGDPTAARGLAEADRGVFPGKPWIAVRE